MTKGYKGFDSQLRCIGFQYEIGQEYEHTGDVELCKKGFHFCENPMDVFGYYPPSDSRYCSVESTGTEDKNIDSSKVSTSRLKINAEIGLAGLIKAGVKFILDKVDWDNKKSTNTGYCSAATNTGDCSAATNTGYCSAATNTGDRSAATNTGYCSAATNTGYCSAATNTGYCSAATNTGYCSAATNTGDCSAATNTGDCSAATNTGDCSAATNTGYCSAATNTGDRSAATNTGYCSAATNTGDRSAAIVSGKQSVAIAIGYQSKAKGSKGCWLVLGEKSVYGELIDVQCRKVDGVKIKEDTFYELINGEFVEVK